MTEIEKMNAICFWLIKNLCIDTNATEARVLQNGVTYKGEMIGDYEITIKKIK